MKTKTIKTGLIASAALATLVVGGAVLASTMTSSAKSTDVVTGPTAAGVNTAYFMVTAPKTVTVPVGTSAADLKNAIGAFAQYTNTKMQDKGEFTAEDLENAKNGEATLEPLGPTNEKHPTDIISVSPVNTSKAGTYTATVTADGKEAGQKNASVNVTVVVVGNPDTTTDVQTGPTAKGVNTAYFMVTAPKTVNVPVGTSAADLKATIGAFAQYTNTEMQNKGEFTAADLENAKMGAATLETFPNAKHPNDLISVSSVDTSKAGTYTATVTADGTEAGQKNAVVKITVVVGNPSTVKTTPVYRLYNPNTGEHFYTTSSYEANADVKAGWQAEGTAFNAPTTGSAVYRLYNKNSGEHFYTMSSYEKDALVKAGWTAEGTSFYAANSGEAIYRAYNPNSRQHVYTASSYEENALVKAGWNAEGTAWYAVK